MNLNDILKSLNPNTIRSLEAIGQEILSQINDGSLEPSSKAGLDELVSGTRFAGLMPASLAVLMHQIPTQGEYQYLELLSRLIHAPEKQDRTGTGTHSLFGHQMRFDLSKGFPLLTTKKVHFHSIVVELLWFLRGDTNIKYLLEHGVHIWTDWRYKEYVNDPVWREDISTQILLTKKEFEERIVNDPQFAAQYGDIGKGYGYQWRNFGHVTDSMEFGTGNPEIIEVQKGLDQIAWVINEIKTNPDSRRLIVSGWNPHEVDQVDLPPCHTLFQFNVQDGKLSCQLYQRSADVFLGVPFNIASYALLTHLVAHECGLEVGEFIWTGGDVHLYSNHVEQAKEQISRQPYPFPTLVFDKQVEIYHHLPGDIRVENYEHHPAIKAPVAV